MKHLVVIALFLGAPPAMAQDGVVALICQARPTQKCVLEMAIEASLAVVPGENETPPWGPIVETASKAGLLDLAISVASRIRKSDSIAQADLWAAAARQDRLAAFARSWRGLNRRNPATPS